MINNINTSTESGKENIVNNSSNTELTKEELLEETDMYSGAFIKTLRDGYKIEIKKYRESEPNIDLMLNPIIDDLLSFSGHKNRSLVIQEYFILDDISSSYLKKDTIEGLNISFEELVHKIGDLFYEPLASVLSSISIELDKQIDSNEEIVKLLKDASNHILKAWDHCKPYVTDINELEKNSKHTFDVEGVDLSNEQLSRAIAYLEDNKLKEFLELLSAKINKDGEADKGRGRVKLANELFSCAEKLKEAGELI